MNRCRYTPGSLGFTLIEMVITVAIVGLLASLVFPMAELAVQRSKERELHAALRQIRTAIDAYKQAFDEGRILGGPRQSGYPPTLDLLVTGVTDAKSPERDQKIYFLRRLPRNPLAPDASLPPEATWGKRSYASPPDDPQEGEDVFDVFVPQTTVALNGIPYRQW